MNISERKKRIAQLARDYRKSRPKRRKKRTARRPVTGTVRNGDYWQARMKVNGKRVYLGTFKSQNAAVKVYQAARAATPARKQYASRRTGKR